MDYKKTIDDLAWIRPRKELRALITFRKAYEQYGVGSEQWTKALDALNDVRTHPPLTETGLSHAVFYAFQARAAWEILDLAEEHGKALKDLYDLHPSGQGGIGLDWSKLSERIWIPAPFLTDIAENTRSILSHDERNCLRHGYGREPKYKDLGQVLDGSGKEKIEKLLTDINYRATAREYCKALLECTRDYITTGIKPKFVPVFQAMLEAYQSEMV